MHDSPPFALSPARRTHDVTACGNDQAQLLKLTQAPAHLHASECRASADAVLAERTMVAQRGQDQAVMVGGELLGLPSGVMRRMTRIWSTSACV